MSVLSRSQVRNSSSHSLVFFRESECVCCVLILSRWSLLFTRVQTHQSSFFKHEDKEYQKYTKYLEIYLPIAPSVSQILFCLFSQNTWMMTDGEVFLQALYHGKVFYMMILNINNIRDRNQPALPTVKLHMNLSLI